MVLVTMESPQLLVDKGVDAPIMQFVLVVDISFVIQRLIPMVMVTMVISQLLMDKVVDALIAQVLPVARVSQVLVAKITVVIPQSQHIETSSCLDKVVHTLVVCNDKSSTSLS